MGRDGEQIRLQGRPLIVIGQADQKAQKRFLHHVFARLPVSQPAVDEGQQPALETVNQFLPGWRVPGPNLGDQLRFGKRGGHERLIPHQEGKR
jgi:hypothetical protein